jgi:hypothetical protein
LPPADLVMADLERFVADRRQHSRVDRSLTLRAVQPLLDHLRGIGVVPEAQPQAPVVGRGLVIEQFVAYLVTERGLARSTIGNYRDVAERFLTGCGWEPGSPASLTGGAVNAFVLSEAARRSPGRLNTVTTALRALLRFLRLHGHAPALVDAVPVAPSWRDRGVVRAVPAEHVAGMLASCDRRTAGGAAGLRGVEGLDEAGFAAR